jgi:hypothetical protein
MTLLLRLNTLLWWERSNPVIHMVMKERLMLPTNQRRRVKPRETKVERAQ